MTPPEPGGLAGRTLLVSGGSRGIGLAVALRAAADGARVALLAKTSEPHPRLEGTVHSAAEAVERAGGQALAVVGDVRREEDVARAVAACAERFGGIDVVVNNASAIDLSGSAELSTKKYDLMAQVNVRGTFLLTRTALPHLLASADGRVLTLSPPVSPDPRWLGAHTAYTVAKYGMTLTTMGFAAEFTGRLGAATLWPATLVDTAATRHLLGDEAVRTSTRRPEIVADAAHALLTMPAERMTARSWTDEEALAAVGVTDLSRYAPPDGREALPDAFL